MSNFAQVRCTWASFICKGKVVVRARRLLLKNLVIIFRIMPTTFQVYNPANGNHNLVGDALEEELKRIERYTALDPEDEYQLKVRFLALIATGHSVSGAVQAINATREPPLPRMTAGRFYGFKNKDKDFALDWEYAFHMATDALEDRAYKFAMDGNASLIQFLLKIRHPKRYSPPQVSKIEGPDGKELIPTEIQFVPVRALTYDKQKNEYSEAEEITDVVSSS
jgi:hypothetical protein